MKRVHSTTLRTRSVGVSDERHCAVETTARRSRSRSRIDEVNSRGWAIFGVANITRRYCATVFVGVGLQSRPVVFVVGARLDTTILYLIVAHGVMLIREVDVSISIFRRHVELEDGGLKDEVVRTMRENESRRIESSDYSARSFVFSPPVDISDEPVVVVAVLSERRAIRHASGDCERDHLGVVVEVKFEYFIAQSFSLLRSATMSRKVRANIDKSDIDSRFRHDRPVVSKHGGVTRIDVSQHKFSDEVGKYSRTLGAEHAIRVQAFVGSHRVENAVVDSAQEKAIVVHPHHPLVAESVQRMPDGDCVKSDHLSVPETPRHLWQLFRMYPRGQRPAGSVGQQAEANVGRAAVEGVRVIAR